MAAIQVSHLVGSCNAYQYTRLEKLDVCEIVVYGFGMKMNLEQDNFFILQLIDIRNN